MADLKWNNNIEILGIVYFYCNQIIETNFERVADKAKANIYLFILAIELLTLYLQQCKDFRGISANIVNIIMCRFADDITLILQDTASLKAELLLIERFAIFYGLKLNLNQTQVM